MLITRKVFEKAKSSCCIVASTGSFSRLCGYDNVIYHQINFILKLSEITILASKWSLQYCRDLILYLSSLVIPLISSVWAFIHISKFFFVTVSSMAIRKESQKGLLKPKFFPFIHKDRFSWYDSLELWDPWKPSKPMVWVFEKHSVIILFFEIFRFYIFL